MPTGQLEVLFIVQGDVDDIQSFMDDAAALFATRRLTVVESRGFPLLPDDDRTN